MIQIEGILLQEELFEEQFVCDIGACKGACCIEGEGGAPIVESEIALYEDRLEDILPFIPANQREEVKKQGVYQTAWDGSLEVPLMPETGACVFSIRDASGVLQCGIEIAGKANPDSFTKPMSCALYPIREKKLPSFQILQYHKWDICSAACSLGESLKVPVFRFLKGPLERKYGEQWYQKLEAFYTQRKSNASS